MCIRDRYNTSVYFRLMVRPKVLGCNREAVDDVLQGFLRVGETCAVVTKQQPSDELLGGFRESE